jgi:hypothetical protein
MPEPASSKAMAALSRVVLLMVERRPPLAAQQALGHCRVPLGNQTRISTDQGRSWSEPIVISGKPQAGSLPHL